MRTTIPLEPKGSPEEVANGALFLASTVSSFILDAEIVVNGGITGALIDAPA